MKTRKQIGSKLPLFAVLLGLEMGGVPPAFAQTETTTLTDSQLKTAFDQMMVQSVSSDPCPTVAGPKLVVPHHVPSIQDAVDQAQDQATIVVLPGRYYENIRIPDGKKIILRTAGGPKTTLLAAKDPQQPAIWVGPQAHACVIGFGISGGSAGIMAGEFLQGPNGPSLGRSAAHVAVQKSEITGAVNGLLLAADHIEVRSVISSRNTKWGAALFGSNVTVRAATVENNPAGGIMAGGRSVCEWGPMDSSVVMVADSNIAFNDGPGVSICNVVLGGVIDSTLVVNKGAGAYFFHVGLGLLENDVLNGTLPLEGAWGDGALVQYSRINVVRNTIALNSHTGVNFQGDDFYGGATGDVYDNDILFNLFGIALEGCGVDPSIRENFMIGNSRDVVIGKGMCPAEPIEPLNLRDI